MAVFFSVLLLFGLAIAALIVPRHILGINDQTQKRRREQEKFQRILEMEKARMGGRTPPSRSRKV